MKLFGKTIEIFEADLNQDLSVTSSVKAQVDTLLHAEEQLCKEEEHTISDKDQSGEELVEDEQEMNNSQQSTRNDSKDHTVSSVINENPKTSKNGEQTGLSQGKSPKRPDKILPCPRCNSMETKFCYFNNYNASQPRHFCKNCQRYWTAGGTMRNVPVGAGRRKSKSFSASQYRQLIVSQVNATARGNDGFVISFGSDSPICENVVSVLNQSDVYRGIEKRPVDNGDDRSCGSSITASSSSQKYGVSAGLDKLSHFPMVIFPTPPYWGCTVPTASILQCVSPISPNLGKHSREGEILRATKVEKDKPLKNNNDVENSEPRRKTLRIDDHAGTGKSSVWSKLGMRSESTRVGGLFDGLQLKGNDKIYGDEKSLFLQANPAAMLRSVKFCEST